jgi:hypothetical protein
MAERNKLSSRTRFEVFKRDRFTCIYCGRKPPQVILHADHVVSISEGGSDDPLNLVTSCEDCNLGKSNVPLESVLIIQTEGLEQRREKAQQLAALNAFLMEERQAIETAAVEIGTYWCDQCCSQFEDRGKQTLIGPRLSRIKTLLTQLPQTTILESIDIAFARMPAYGSRDDLKTWKYFCGVIRNKIQEAENHG